jgi:hypothetical protein
MAIILRLMFHISYVEVCTGNSGQVYVYMYVYR